MMKCGTLVKFRILQLSDTMKCDTVVKLCRKVKDTYLKIKFIHLSQPISKASFNRSKKVLSVQHSKMGKQSTMGQLKRLLSSISLHLLPIPTLEGSPNIDVYICMLFILTAKHSTIISCISAKQRSS